MEKVKENMNITKFEENTVLAIQTGTRAVKQCEIQGKRVKLATSLIFENLRDSVLRGKVPAKIAAYSILERLAWEHPGFERENEKIAGRAKNEKTLISKEMGWKQAIDNFAKIKDPADVAKFNNLCQLRDKFEDTMKSEKIEEKSISELFDEIENPPEPVKTPKKPKFEDVISAFFAGCVESKECRELAVTAILEHYSEFAEFAELMDSAFPATIAV